MIESLPTTITTFATKSKTTLGSLIKSVKADKVQMAELLRNVSSFSGRSRLSA